MTIARYERKNLTAALLFQGLFIEFVAYAANGEHPLGLAVVLFDRLAEPPDMHVDRSRIDENVAAPDAVEKLVARQHAIGVLHQKAQKLKLLQREPRRLAPNDDFVRC